MVQTLLLSHETPRQPLSLQALSPHTPLIYRYLYARLTRLTLPPKNIFLSLYLCRYHSEILSVD